MWLRGLIDNDNTNKALMKIFDKHTIEELWFTKRNKEWWEERENIMLKMLEEYKSRG